MTKQSYTCFLILIIFPLIAKSDYFYQKYEGYNALKSKKYIDVRDDKIFNKKDYTRIGYHTKLSNTLLVGGEIVIDDVDYLKLAKTLNLDEINMEILGSSTYSVDKNLDLYGKLGLSKASTSFDPKLVLGTSYALTENVSINTNLTHIENTNQNTMAAMSINFKW